jgi:hypothetical protein
MNQRELEMELAALRDELEVKESFIMASQKPDTGTQFTRQDSLNSSQVLSSSGHYLSNYTDGRQRGDLKEKLGEILGDSGVQSGRRKASSRVGKEFGLEVKGSGVSGERPYDGKTIDVKDGDGGRTEDIKNKLPESQKKLMNEIMQNNLGGWDLEAPDQVIFFYWESKFFRGMNLAVGEFKIRQLLVCRICQRATMVRNSRNSLLGIQASRGSIVILWLVVGRPGFRIADCSLKSPK